MVDLKKCDFCLETVFERHICNLCENKDRFYFTRLCEECMSIHLDKHEENIDLNNNIDILELSKANKTGIM